MPQALGFLLFAGPLGSIFSFGTLVAASQVVLGLGLSVAGQLLFGARRPETPRPEDGKYNLRQNVPSLPIVLGKVKKGGDYVFLEETGGHANHIMVHAAHRIEGFVSHYLHDELVTLNGSNQVTIPEHFDLAVNIYSKIGLDAETAYANVIAAFPTIWTSDHRGDGLASVHMICTSQSSEHQMETYPQGMPVHTAVLEGALLFDPREGGHDPDDDDTWEYAENLALERLWHLTHPSGGKMTFDDMEMPDWINAADVCDQIITNKAGGSEPRYHGGFWYRYENDPVEVGRIMDQAAEMVLYETAEGKVGVHAGEYVAPDIRLTENDILALTYDANRRKNSNVLAVRGRFTDPSKVFNTVDAAIYGDPYVGDNSQRTKTVDNVAVQRHNHMQRLQKIAFIRANAPRVQLLCDYEPAKNVPYRRYIRVHYPPKLTEAIIEVTGRPKLSLRNLTYEIEGIVLPGDIYPFDAATEEGDPPGTITEIEHVGVPTPAGFDVVIEREIVAAGQSAAYGLGTWTAQSSALILEMEWQRTSGGATQTARIQTGETELRSSYLADGAEYRFRARNWSAGASSPWTDYVTRTAVADDAAPGLCTSISVAGGLGRAAVGYTTPVAANLRDVVIYRVATGVSPTDANIVSALTQLVPTLTATPKALTDGDATRTNLLLTPDFASDTNWTKGAGVTIAAGVAALATAGTVSALTQAQVLSSGTVYRTGYTISGYSAGAVRARLLGGTTVTGVSRSANGTFLEKLTAVTGNNNFNFATVGATTLNIDNASLFAETVDCAPQGVWDYYIKARNASGVGTLQGPYTATVI